MYSSPAWMCVGVLLLGCGTTGRAREVDQWVLEVPGEAPRPVTLPAHLPVPDEPLTYRLRTEIDTEGGALAIPCLPAIVRLRVDGQSVVANNADEAFASYRRRGPHVFPLPERAGRAELVLEVDHRWTRSAWIDPVPRIVPAGQSDQTMSGVRIFNSGVSICAIIALLQIGITCLVIFGFDRSRRSYLLFSVQAISGSFYPAFVLGATQPIFGPLDVPLVGASLVLAPVAALYFTHDFFGLRPPPRGVAVWTALALAWCCAWSDPFQATEMIAPVTVGTVSLIAAYQLATCARLVFRDQDRASAALLFLAWFGLASTAWTDLWFWMGFGELAGGARLATLGLTLFGFFQTLLLSLSHTRSLSGAEERDEAVAAREEIERLNDELRRQVHDRSGQLYAALAILGGADDAPELEPGMLVGDRYRVQSQLGAGGMGFVYAVERVSDGGLYALKVTREVHGAALARLAREAQVATQIAHENVVRVVDVDVAHEGFLFIVMELVEGAPLEARAKRSVAWRLDVLRQIARGLGALHAAGLVHRDLKPANVLVTEATPEEPRVKITDFGISRALPTLAPGEPSSQDVIAAARATRSLRVDTASGSSAEQGSDQTLTDLLASESVSGSGRRSSSLSRTPSRTSSLTQTGLLPGTPLYIAPELIRGNDALSSAADVFSWGVLAYELLGHERPFCYRPGLMMDSRSGCSMAIREAQIRLQGVDGGGSREGHHPRGERSPAQMMAFAFGGRTTKRRCAGRGRRPRA